MARPVETNGRHPRAAAAPRPIDLQCGESSLARRRLSYNVLVSVQHGRETDIVVQISNTSDQESCMEFVCGAIVLFEKSFGSENKAAMQKVLKEAVDNFGPDSVNEKIECMFPVYSMLRKYCKSSFVHEVFERLYDKDSYRRCAMFYVEWSRSHPDFGKKLVASLDFTLEDYDLGDDACVNSKSLEVLKREDNENNIKNSLSEEVGPSSSSISPVKRLTPSPTLSDNWTDHDGPMDEKNCKVDSTRMQTSPKMAIYTLGGRVRKQS
ncbi:unnamed protein product [Angiostrongylus costaricensis]|uniref:BUB1 N-terminal domain-containing protein n=1 Tax=Angiostrongylus costaricensis TaxID=334426 RepID=A0A158PE51_ANGCS|nr:unnamed protein product [Angiostrongylus costaricensis]